jgi:hypothetical protein
MVLYEAVAPEFAAVPDGGAKITDSAGRHLWWVLGRGR